MDAMLLDLNCWMLLISQLLKVLVLSLLPLIQLFFLFVDELLSLILELLSQEFVNRRAQVRC